MSSARVLANRYRLDQHAAEGGMGSVWIATDLQLERRVAVKLMSAAFAEQNDARARFLREAQSAAKIQSPHVVSTLDYGVDGTTPYIVMEWLEGESLGARLKRELRLGTDATGTILRQVARGLRSAHELGVVHRDLKPDNLFLQRDHDEEIVKILDFGVAKARGQTGEQTRTGVILGSLRYMSPEQARANRDTDHRSDLWSLGVITYRCLTGELPFSGNSDGDLLVNICTEAPLPVSAHQPSLAPLDGFFVRCFAKEPSARFASAAELASAYFAALGVDDPSKRTVSPEVARASLPSFALPPPAAPPQPVRRPAPPHAAMPLAAPPAATPSAPGSGLPAVTAPPAATPSAPSSALPPLSLPKTEPWLTHPSASDASPAATLGAGSDPASRSAILVASMPPPRRRSSKLGLAVGIGGAVGVALALGSLAVLMSTGSSTSTNGEPAVARGAERASAEATSATASPPRRPGLAGDSGEAPVAEGVAAASGRAESVSDAVPAASAAPAAAVQQSAAVQPSAAPRAASSAVADAAATNKSPGTKTLRRPLIPSNPY